MIKLEESRGIKNEQHDDSNDVSENDRENIDFHSGDQIHWKKKSKKPPKDFAGREVWKKQMVRR